MGTLSSTSSGHSSDRWTEPFEEPQDSPPPLPARSTQVSLNLVCFLLFYSFCCVVFLFGGIWYVVWNAFFFPSNAVVFFDISYSFLSLISLTSLHE